jgi:hypothetical protein
MNRAAQAFHRLPRVLGLRAMLVLRVSTAPSLSFSSTASPNLLTPSVSRLVYHRSGCSPGGLPSCTVITRSLDPQHRRSSTARPAAAHDCVRRSVSSRLKTATPLPSTTRTARCLRGVSKARLSATSLAHPSASPPTQARSPPTSSPLVRRILLSRRSRME